MSTPDDTGDIALVNRAFSYGDSAAIIQAGTTYTYAQLLTASARVAGALLADRDDLAGERVCFMVAPGFDYVATQWGIFRAGGVAVPLCLSHPAPELEHVLDDARPVRLVADREHAAKLAPLGQARGMSVHDAAALRGAPEPNAASLPRVASTRHALLIYTSGTTGKPKAAITTHGIFEAQLQSVASAWELNRADRVLHVLPLHHLHGVLNALGAPLYAGGCVELMPRFDADAVLNRLCTEPAPTVFMGVPTMYAKLVQCAEARSDAERAEVRGKLARLRLMISGSAALPTSLLTRFERLSGHVLLERYGMTELGMALGNPLRGERRPGSVGLPFPGVDARIVDERGAAVPDGCQGELQIRGPNVFAGYFGRPEATRDAFTPDGFFRTGDVAILEHGYYRLLGRESVDIIKTGGFKVSALEIEETLREHPSVAEVAVIGVPDAEWGQRVAANVVLRSGASLDLDELRRFGKERLAPYKVPTRLRCLPELPRNAMGKVHKPSLSQRWQDG